MADKGWTAQVATAAGVAAAIGAAQLGLGYGLAVVVWTAADESTWLGSLGWATWIAASSTVFGAVIAARLTRSPGPDKTDAAASRSPMRLRTATVAPNAKRPPNSLELSGPAQQSGAPGPADSLQLSRSPQSAEPSPPSESSASSQPSQSSQTGQSSQSSQSSQTGQSSQPLQPLPSAWPSPSARPSRRSSGPWRLALATSAAIGALLTVALVAVPAHFSVRPDTFTPATVAGGYTLLGVLVGLVIAYWAVVSRPVAANLFATAAWLWILAIAAVIVDLTQHRASATYLTSWQFADSHATQHGIVSWPSSLLTLLSALLLGLLSVWPSVRRGNFTVGASASGAVGPLLVAAAFFVLAPQLTTALGALESAYLIAPYAVLAGLGGSALTVAIGRRAAERRSDPSRSDRAARATQRTRKTRSPRTAQPAGKARPTRTDQAAGKAKPVAGERPPAETQATDQGQPTRTAQPQPAAASKPQRGTARTSASIAPTPRSTSEAIPPASQSQAVAPSAQSKGAAAATPADGDSPSSTDPGTSDKSGFWSRFRRKGSTSETAEPTAPDQPRSSRKSGKSDSRANATAKVTDEPGQSTGELPISRPRVKGPLRRRGNNSDPATPTGRATPPASAQPDDPTGKPLPPAPAAQRAKTQSAAEAGSGATGPRAADPDVPGSGTTGSSSTGSSAAGSTGQAVRTGSVDARPADTRSTADQPAKAQPGLANPAKTQPAKSQPAKAQPAANEPGRAQPTKAQPTKGQPPTAQPQRNTMTPAQPPPNTPVPIQPPPNAPAPLQPGPSAPNPVSAPKPTATPEPKSTVAPPPASPPVAQIAPPPASKPAKSARTTKPRPRTDEENG